MMRTGIDGPRRTTVAIAISAKAPPAADFAGLIRDRFLPEPERQSVLGSDTAAIERTFSVSKCNSYPLIRRSGNFAMT